MDSVTQALFGAVVGQAAFGRRLGRKAAAYGAVGGLLPDIDVFASFAYGPFGHLEVHRGITHSLFFAPVMGPLLGEAVFRWQRRPAARRPGGGGPPPDSRYAWMGLFFLALLTHPLIDLFTSYGTQLLTPFSDRRFAVNGLAIIDLFYSAPLLAAVLLGLSGRISMGRQRFACAAALLWVAGYTAFAVDLNRRTEQEAQHQLAAAGLAEAEVTAYPTLLQPFSRRVVARLDNEVRIGFLTMWDPQPVSWTRIEPAQGPAIERARAMRPFRIFEWFAMGETVWRAKPAGGGILVQLSDLRYGVPGSAEPGLWSVSAVFGADGAVPTLVRAPHYVTDNRPITFAAISQAWRLGFDGAAISAP